MGKLNKYKKLFILVAVLFVLTGCRTIKLNDTEGVVDQVLSNETKLYNEFHNGYKFYKPREVSKQRVNGYNIELLYDNNKLYLYIDLIAYYHKVDKEHIEDKDVYFYKELKYNKKKGYLCIKELNKKYYIDMYYNFGHMQALVEKKDINKTVMQMSYILKSIKYNNTIIESLIGENKIEYQEEKFNLFKSKDNNETYLNIVDDKNKKKDDKKKEEELFDEDNLKIDFNDDNDLDD